MDHSRPDWDHTPYTWSSVTPCGGGEEGGMQKNGHNSQLQYSGLSPLTVFSSSDQSLYNVRHTVMDSLLVRLYVFNLPNADALNTIQWTCNSSHISTSAPSAYWYHYSTTHIKRMRTHHINHSHVFLLLHPVQDLGTSDTSLT